LSKLGYRVAILDSFEGVSGAPGREKVQGQALAMTREADGVTTVFERTQQGLWAVQPLLTVFKEGNRRVRGADRYVK